MHNWRTAWLKLPFSEPIHPGTAFTPVQVEGCTDKMWSYVSIQPKGFEGRASNVLIQGKRERSCILLQAILGILVIQKTTLRGVTLVWRSRCTNEYAFMEYAGCGITDGRNNCFLGFFFLWIIFLLCLLWFGLKYCQITTKCREMSNFYCLLKLISTMMKLQSRNGLVWHGSTQKLEWIGRCQRAVIQLWYRQKLNLGEKSWE